MMFSVAELNCLQLRVEADVAPLFVGILLGEADGVDLHPCPRPSGGPVPVLLPSCAFLPESVTRRDLPAGMLSAAIGSLLLFLSMMLHPAKFTAAVVVLPEH